MSEERDIRRLRAAVAAGFHDPAAYGEVCLGQPVGLARGRVHEVLGEAADIFALAAAAGTAGPVLWIGPERDVRSLAPTGLQRFVDPARLILVSGRDRREILWAGETALRARSALCVILQLRDGPDLKESRRLQIAAEESGAIGIILIQAGARMSATETRWQCEVIDRENWKWVCIKNKHGKPGAWQVSWKGRADAPDLVALVAAASA